MKFERLIHASGTVADFYDEALASLGALCERTWHDRLEVVAEGASARLWNDANVLAMSLKRLAPDVAVEVLQAFLDVEQPDPDEITNISKIH